MKLLTRDELKEVWIRTLLTYTAAVTWFGSGSVALAWGLATATIVGRGGIHLYSSLLRRYGVMSADDETIGTIAKERGAGRRRGGQRAQMLLIVRPTSTTVTAITSTATSAIEVADSTPFSVGSSVRIRSGDGATTETRSVSAIGVASGPNGGDELVVALLGNVYDPVGDEVAVLLRTTIPMGSPVTTRAGQVFETLDTLITGDANPVLTGESTALALADKVWCEATTTGEGGNVGVGSATGFDPAIAGVRAVSNPERARGGSDRESLLDLKDRIIHGPAAVAQETVDAFEALLKRAHHEVLRVIPTSSTTIGTMALKVLRRNGGTFSSADLRAMETYAQARVRSHLAIELSNITLTAVEAEYQITLKPNADLRSVLVAASDTMAVYLDYRRWPFGEEVDNSKLLAIVRDTPGVASLDTSTALPAAPVTVGEESLPHLTRLSLLDTDSGRTLNAALAMGF